MIPTRRQIQGNGFKLVGLIEATPPVFKNRHEP